VRAYSCNHTNSSREAFPTERGWLLPTFTANLINNKLLYRRMVVETANENSGDEIELVHYEQKETGAHLLALNVYVVLVRFFHGAPMTYPLQLVNAACLPSP